MFSLSASYRKYLKGYIIYATGELQEGHNLVKLCKKIMVFDKSFSSFLKDMAFVNTFYIETRYPSKDPLKISKEDVQDVLRY